MEKKKKHNRKNPWSKSRSRNITQDECAFQGSLEEILSKSS